MLVTEKKFRRFCGEHLPKPSGPGFLLPTGPIDMEIGCGVGMFAIRRALSQPERSFIAIEHTQARFSRFSRRYQNHGAPRNLYPVHANAISWVHWNLPDESIDHIFILYPNPYPKNAHQNRRWHAMPFMDRLVEVLKPGGTITIATNERFYVDEALSAFSSREGMRVLSNQTIQNPEDSRTHFERKYLERQQICFNLVFQKRAWQH